MRDARTRRKGVARRALVSVAIGVASAAIAATTVSAQILGGSGGNDVNLPGGGGIDLPDQNGGGGVTLPGGTSVHLPRGSNGGGHDVNLPGGGGVDLPDENGGGGVTVPGGTSVHLPGGSNGGGHDVPIPVFGTEEPPQPSYGASFSARQPSRARVYLMRSCNRSSSCCQSSIASGSSR